MEENNLQSQDLSVLNTKSLIMSLGIFEWILVGGIIFDLIYTFIDSSYNVWEDFTIILTLAISDLLILFLGLIIARRFLKENAVRNIFLFVLTTIFLVKSFELLGFEYSQKDSLFGISIILLFGGTILLRQLLEKRLIVPGISEQGEKLIKIRNLLTETSILVFLLYLGLIFLGSLPGSPDSNRSVFNAGFILSTFVLLAFIVNVIAFHKHKETKIKSDIQTLSVLLFIMIAILLEYASEIGYF